MNNYSETKITVFGSSQPKQGTKQYEDARAVGRALADAGWTVVTGGYKGVMEAASCGAKEAGGKTIGVTTAYLDFINPRPNNHVDLEIKMQSYAERLIRLVTMSDGYVIMRGGSGTLTELFLTWELEKNGSIPQRPLVLFGEEWKHVIDFLAGELPDELSFSSYCHLLAYTIDPSKIVPLIQERLSER